MERDNSRGEKGLNQLVAQHLCRLRAGIGAAELRIVSLNLLYSWNTEIIVGAQLNDVMGDQLIPRTRI